MPPQLTGSEFLLGDQLERTPLLWRQDFHASVRGEVGDAERGRGQRCCRAKEGFGDATARDLSKHGADDMGNCGKN